VQNLSKHYVPGTGTPPGFRCVAPFDAINAAEQRYRKYKCATQQPMPAVPQPGPSFLQLNAIQILPVMLLMVDL